MRFSKEHIIKVEKKAKLIYDLFSTGKYQKDDLIYNYVLPKYWVNIDDETGTPIIVFHDTMKLYTIMKNPISHLNDPTPVEEEYRYLWNDAKRRVTEKFERFNIEIRWP
jgi:hypothetical protein